MDKFRLIMCLSATILAVSSCGKMPSASQDAREITILPGECLNNNTLWHHLFEYHAQEYVLPYIVNSQRNAFGELEANCMQFAFELDLDAEKENLHRCNKTEYRYRPTENVFSSFGESTKLVKEQYEVVYDSIKESPYWKGGTLCSTTIYYSGGLVIKADEDFAGVPAGENIASVAHVFYSPEAFLAHSCIDILSDAGIPESYVPLTKGISIRIPTEGFEIIDRAVKLQFEIPVKVGLFLHYLNDRMSDPTATMQFRDEVLTCEFTMSGVLR
ncbi:MAG: hypothetical protein J6V81_00625 [Bacteroidales bacterium]|nr:hypothetical protein [Bacteroidales bacterium]